MTREEAKNIIQDMLDDAEKYGDIDYDDLNDFISASQIAIKALSDVPDIYVGRWIPCIEQLPKKGEEVLITNHWHEVRMAYLTDRTRGKVLCWVVDHNSYHPVDWNEILAWMPLPIGYEVKDD